MVEAVNNLMLALWASGWIPFKDGNVLLALCWVFWQRQLHTMIEYLVLLLFRIAGVRFLFLYSLVLVKVWLISNFLKFVQVPVRIRTRVGLLVNSVEFNSAIWTEAWKLNFLIVNKENEIL